MARESETAERTKRRGEVPSVCTEQQSESEITVIRDVSWYPDNCFLNLFLIPGLATADENEGMAEGVHQGNHQEQSLPDRRRAQRHRVEMRFKQETGLSNRCFLIFLSFSPFQILRFIAKRLTNPNRKPRVNHIDEKRKEQEERDAFGGEELHDVNGLHHLLSSLQETSAWTEFTIILY